jgi:glycosyltransferase involved in cell wall biosynthesis
MREKKVLIIAYYFPPLGMGGVQRVAKFTKYLPSFGWKPHVLTVKDVQYLAQDRSLLEDIPPQAEITRTGSFDPLRLWFVLKRIFRKNTDEDKPVKAYSGGASKLLSWIFFPDNKIGWIPFALMKGLSLCQKERFDLIFSTSPPPSLHLTGYLLKLLTGIPWVADFRDPWVGYKFQSFPTPLHDFLKKRLERQIITNSDRVVVANPVIKGELKKRHALRDKFHLVNQGYDEEDFGDYRPSAPEKFTVGYLGTFSSDCNPEPAFLALGDLIRQNLVPKGKIKLLHVGGSIRLDVERLAQQCGLGGVLEVRGHVSHKNALIEMGSVSLLLLITSDDPRVFPAKIFEYLRLRKPIIGIVPQESKMAGLLREMKALAVIPPEDRGGIRQALLSCFTDFEKGQLSAPAVEDDLQKFERKVLTSRLASLFDEVISE